MEGDVVVVSCSTMGEEVLTSLGHEVTVELEVEGPQRSHELHEALLLRLLARFLCLRESLHFLCREPCARESTVVAVFLWSSSQDV